VNNTYCGITRQYYLYADPVVAGMSIHSTNGQHYPNHINQKIKRKTAIPSSLYFKLPHPSLSCAPAIKLTSPQL